jgi:hypothetical protein
MLQRTALGVEEVLVRNEGASPFRHLRPSVDKLRTAWIVCSGALAERQHMSAMGGAND